MGLRHRLWITVIIGGVVAGGSATYLANAASDPAPVSRVLASETRFSFDGESLGELGVAAISGGQVSAEAHDAGQAVRFPPRCRVYAGRSCPRVVLESRAVPNPSSTPVRFGAAVLMEAGDTDAGENVIQKGFSRGRGQFKLQVDGVAGQPSCVLVGTGSSRIYMVTARESVSDGRWHAIECARTGSDFSIAVDGEISGRIRVPAALSIVNSDPLRIGGKGLSPNNDQFHGVVDDVFVAIGA